MFCKAVLKLLLPLLVATAPLLANVPYNVRILGIDDADIANTVSGASSLLSLRDKPPPTMSALRRRAEGDVADLVNVMRSFGYYDARIEAHIDGIDGNTVVILRVYEGTVYRLRSVQLLADEAMEETPAFFDYIGAPNLELVLDEPAKASEIIYARGQLLRSISKQGYPLAAITDEQVLVDVIDKKVDLIFQVDTGPRALFGDTEFLGLQSVKPSFIRGKILWNRHRLFDPRCLEATEEALLQTQLFEYVNVHYDDELTSNGELPIIVDLAESKHRSIGAGVSVTTQQGPGVSGEWEHRNVAGYGQTFNVAADIWNRLQHASMMYRLPDFVCPIQELVWLAELHNEETTSFEERSFSLSTIVEAQCTDYTTVSYGVSVKQLHSTKSDNSGDFTLIKLPLMWRWNTSNNILNPTRGYTAQVKMTPTQQVLRSNLEYLETIFTGTAYKSLDCDSRYVFAGKVVAGNILGAGRRAIPAPERFYSGSENTLRGYNYMTVSPLNEENEPIGGRSIMVLSSEMRIRFRENLGCVAFYEIGNVYEKKWPQLHKKQLQSIGFGARYYTPVGPLRLDVAFPLNGRRVLDDSFQFYFSIGQAF